MKERNRESERQAGGYLLVSILNVGSVSPLQSDTETLLCVEPPNVSAEKKLGPLRLTVNTHVFSFQKLIFPWLQGPNTSWIIGRKRTRSPFFFVSVH